MCLNAGGKSMYDDRGCKSDEDLTAELLRFVAVFILLQRFIK